MHIPLVGKVESLVPAAVDRGGTLPLRSAGPQPRVSLRSNEVPLAAVLSGLSVTQWELEDIDIMTAVSTSLIYNSLSISQFQWSSSQHTAQPFWGFVWKQLWVAHNWSPVVCVCEVCLNDSQWRVSSWWHISECCECMWEGRRRAVRAGTGCRTIDRPTTNVLIAYRRAHHAHMLCLSRRENESLHDRQLLAAGTHAARSRADMPTVALGSMGRVNSFYCTQTLYIHVYERQTTCVCGAPTPPDPKALYIVHRPAPNGPVYKYLFHDCIPLRLYYGAIKSVKFVT